MRGDSRECECMTLIRCRIRDVIKNDSPKASPGFCVSNAVLSWFLEKIVWRLHMPDFRDDWRLSSSMFGVTRVRVI